MPTGTLVLVGALVTAGTGAADAGAVRVTVTAGAGLTLLLALPVASPPSHTVIKMTAVIAGPQAIPIKVSGARRYSASASRASCRIMCQPKSTYHLPPISLHGIGERVVLLSLVLLATAAW